MENSGTTKNQSQSVATRRVLVTGATGFIGVLLLKALRSEGWQVIALVRDYARARLQLGPDVTLVRSLDEIDAATRLEVVINLAGENIAAGRWSRARRRILLDSRLDTTRELIRLIQRLQHKPSQLLNASAIGFYGNCESSQLTEAAAAGDGFSSRLCMRWEEEARKAEVEGVSVTLLRLGVVLAAEGGMLGRLLPLFRLGLGGRTGSGEQYLSWIHRDDVISALLWLLQHPLPGAVNLTAPYAVSQAEFSRMLAASLGRPALCPQPAFVIRLLFGEMGEELLLGGSNVVPERLLKQGFVFRYEQLEQALKAEFSV